MGGMLSLSSLQLLVSDSCHKIFKMLFQMWRRPCELVTHTVGAGSCRAAGRGRQMSLTRRVRTHSRAYVEMFCGLYSDKYFCYNLSYRKCSQYFFIVFFLFRLLSWRGPLMNKNGNIPWSYLLCILLVIWHTYFHVWCIQ